MNKRDLKELIPEHKRLIKVMKTKTRDDDRREIKHQAKELRQYKSQLKRKSK
jgi:hypothetical protein